MFISNSSQFGMIKFLVLKRKNSLWRQPVWDFFMVFGLPGGILRGLQEKKLVSFRHTFGVANCAKSFGSHQAAEIICWVPETSMDCFEGPEDAMFFHVDGENGVHRGRTNLAAQ